MQVQTTFRILGYPGSRFSSFWAPPPEVSRSFSSARLTGPRDGIENLACPDAANSVV